MTLKKYIPAKKMIKENSEQILDLENHNISNQIIQRK